MSGKHFTPKTGCLSYWAKELLTVAYWWDCGLHSQAPEWVRKHPLWPPNNDRFHKPTAGTASPGHERLWENIVTDFGIDINAKMPPCHETDI
jgi:hypothetical protein